MGSMRYNELGLDAIIYSGRGYEIAHCLEGLTGKITMRRGQKKKKNYIKKLEQTPNAIVISTEYTASKWTRR